MGRIKKNYILTQVAEEYLVVAVGSEADKFNGMLQLNDTGAYIWKKLEEGLPDTEIVAAMMDHFEDVDKQTAEKELADFLQIIDRVLEKE